MTGDALIPFVDTHVHFWDLRHEALTWCWLQVDAEAEELGDYGAIKAVRYEPEDFRAEARFQGVSKVVHMQAAIGSADPVEETRWLEMLAERDGIPNAVIAYVDLALPDAYEQLLRHAESPKLRGIRDRRFDDYLENAGWWKGYGLLRELQLVCCDATPIERMPAAAKLAAAHPETVYCLDHVGYPVRRDREYFGVWSRAMRTLARVENAVVKISALGTYDHRWTLDSLRPWVHECLEVWGTDRVVFGSNWPVDRLFSSYDSLVGAYRAIVGDLSEQEQHAVLHGNAERIFRLGI